MKPKFNFKKPEFLAMRANVRKGGPVSHWFGGVFGTRYQEDEFGNHWDALAGKQGIRDRMDECKTEAGTIYVITESRDCDGVYGGNVRQMPANINEYVKFWTQCHDDAEGPMSVYIVSEERGKAFEPYSYGGWE